MTLEISGRTREENEPKYHNEEGGSEHGSLESSGDNEVTTSSSEHLKGEIHSKKTHDAGHAEQQVLNDTREGRSKKIVERGRGRQVAGRRRGWKLRVRERWRKFRREVQIMKEKTEAQNRQ